MPVGLRFGMTAAGDAAEDRVVVRIRMAGQARNACVSAGCYRERGVVKHPLVPGIVGVLVAVFARGGESCRSVIGIGRILVIRSVTSVTVPRCSMVHTVLVAGFTWNLRMPSGQNEELVVVERGLVPIGISGFVAGIAVGGEARLRMVRVPGGIVVGFVAAVARFRSSFVLAVLMAGLAWDLGMASDKREELVVIERGLVPVRI